MARKRKVVPWRTKPLAQLTRAERLMAFVERYCRVPEGAQVGQAMRLAPFQERFIYDVYDNPHGTRRAFLSMARKNAKTATIAALLLGHICGPEARTNSQIVSGAMSRDQASLVFNLAAKMIALDPDLTRATRIIPSGKRIIGLADNVEYRALAADGTTAHGLSPVLAILDEVGQVQGPRSDFVDAITTSQGAHDDPLLICISTQAANDADLFSIWIDDAERSRDPHTVAHIYAAPKGAAILDPASWQAANPALGLFRSLKDVEEQAKQAARMPSAEASFRNLILNQRVSTFAPFVSLDVWRSNSGEPFDLDGCDVWVGLDLSAKTDLTALVAIAERDGKFSVVPMFWTPEEGLRERSDRDRQPYDVWVRDGFIRTTPGRTVDFGFLVLDVAAILSGANVRAVAYDRWRIDVLRRELERAGIELPLVEFGQGFRDMAPAVDRLEELLLNGKLAHGGNPVLTMCAANATVTRDAAGNRKLDKHKATGRIDGMVALAMAVGAMSKEAEQSDDLGSFFRNPVIA